jgi:chemotaxis response regulator CheB
VQHPDEADIASMPLAAIAADHPDACLRIDQIAQRVAAFCSRNHPACLSDGRMSSF